MCALPRSGGFWQGWRGEDSQGIIEERSVSQAAGQESERELQPAAASYLWLAGDVLARGARPAAGSLCAPTRRGWVVSVRVSYRQTVPT